MADDKPQFLNVDLHIESRQDLAGLAAALGPEDSWQTWDYRGTNVLHRSPVGLGRRSETPSSIILTLAKQVRQLRGAARTAWNSAKVREFDIGFEAGTVNRPGEWVISPDALQAAARVGAQIRITVYGPEPSAQPKARSRRKQ